MSKSNGVYNQDQPPVGRKVLVTVAIDLDKFIPGFEAGVALQIDSTVGDLESDDLNIIAEALGDCAYQIKYNLGE